MYIERLDKIDDILNLQNIYYKKYKILPYNVSNWTVSASFRNYMQTFFEFTMLGNPIDYTYSYSISNIIKERILIKLGVQKDTIEYVTCLFFPNNTISISNICNFLQKRNYKNVCVVNPSYFSVTACLKTYHIKYGEEYISRDMADYHISFKNILSKNYDVVWITSPIYSTGILFSKEIIEGIFNLLEQNILVIADESFTISGQELASYFSKYTNFISICSPHKALSFNGYKFSTVICSAIYEDFFDQWLDVFSGNLPQTTISAIHHFLSDNFDICCSEYNKFIYAAWDKVQYIIKQYPNVNYDKKFHGNLLTLYINNLSYNNLKDINFLKKVIDSTHAFYYPGFINGFHENLGFCFRINLALYEPEFLAALNRLLRYLSNEPH